MVLPAAGSAPGRAGIKPMCGSRNPIACLELQDVQELSNFFERRVSAYQIGVTGPVTFDDDFQAPISHHGRLPSGGQMEATMAGQPTGDETIEFVGTDAAQARLDRLRARLGGADRVAKMRAEMAEADRRHAHQRG